MSPFAPRLWGCLGRFAGFGPQTSFREDTRTPCFLLRPRGPVGAGRSRSPVAPAGLPRTAGCSDTSGRSSRGRAPHAAGEACCASPPEPNVGHRQLHRPLRPHPGSPTSCTISATTPPYLIIRLCKALQSGRSHDLVKCVVVCSGTRPGIHSLIPRMSVNRSAATNNQSIHDLPVQ